MTEKANGRRAGGRGNGEGMAPRQRRDGRWECRVTAASGKARSVYGKTAKEARDKQRALRKAIDAGLDPSTKRQKVGDYLAAWLRDVAAQRVQAKTLRGYEEIVRLHLAPALGHHYLDALTPQHVQAILNEKARALSPRRVINIRAVLRSALQQALVWGLTTRNVAGRVVQPPRDDCRRVEGIPAGQARALLAAIEADRLGPLFTVALMTGMRQGELLGLRWRDVDLDAGTAHVRQTLKALPGEPTFGPPKSDTSRRVVPLDDLAAGALRVQKDRQTWGRRAAAEAWQEWGGGLVFTRLDGRPLNPQETTRRLQRLAADAGLGHVTFHQLRHGFASLMAASGATLAEVRDLLGHSTITLTANTYTHLFPEVKRDAVRRMGDLVRTGTKG